MSSKYQLTYNHGKRCGDETYSIGIPDNFAIEEGAEDREFIAWLPGDEDGYMSADITFYAGKVLQQNDNDTRLLVPELCSTLIENTFWGNPFSRMMCKSSKFIPLDKEHPAGGINAGYDEDSFMYNISVFLPDCIKTMRVQVCNVQEKDIAACDRMVVDWMHTMKCAKAFDVAKKLDDPYFTKAKLTEELVAEWKNNSDIHFTIIQLLLQNRIQVRAAKYQAEASNGDSEKSVRNDVKHYVDAAAKSMESFLEMGMTGLEGVKENNPDNPLIKDLCDVLNPAVMSNDEISSSIDGGKTNIRAKVGNIQDIRERFSRLDESAEAPEVKEKTANPNFVHPTYNDGREAVLGTMVVAIPDHMLTLEEAKPVDKDSENFLEQLRSRYAFVAIPDDFEKGFDFYTAGSFCINISKPQSVPQFSSLFNVEAQKKAGIELDIESNLVNIVTGLLKQNGKYSDEYPVEYVCGGEKFGVVLAQTDGLVDPIENWASYMFVVFQESDIYQGNVYINCLGDFTTFRAAVITWLKTFRLADKKQIEAHKRATLKEALGDLATADGDIDAVKVSQMFFEDIVFVNDYEVTFDGTHHEMKRLQFNADVQNKYPTIVSNMAIIWPEIFKVVSSIENNEHLIIPKNQFHKNLLEVTWDQPITGTTVFNLCAYHMIKIVESEIDKYVVAIDSNLIDGIPQAYAFVAEFIKALRDYNEKKGPFTANMASMGNMYGGISKDIDNPITGAAKHESMVTISVGTDDHPYSEACEKVYKAFPAKTSHVPSEVQELIQTFEWKWQEELQKTNDAILRTKDTPITRPNDGRIRKITDNIETIIRQYSSKLEKAMEQLDDVGKQLLSDQASETEIKDLCEWMIKCYEKLHMHTSYEFYRDTKQFKHVIESKYTNLARKWKKVYNALPSIHMENVQTKIDKKENELSAIKKDIGIDNRRKANKKRAVVNAEEVYKKAQANYEETVRTVGEEIHQYETEKEILEASFVHNKDAIEEAERNIDELEKSIIAIEKEYSDAISTKENSKKLLDADLEKMMKERSPIAFEEETCRRKAETAVLFKKKKQQEYEEVSERLKKKDGEIKECESAISALIAEMDSLAKEMNKKITEKSDQKQPWIKSKELLELENEGNQSRLEDLDYQIRINKDELAKAETAMQKAEKEIQIRKQEHAELEKTTADKEAVRDKLQIEIADLKKEMKGIKVSEVPAKEKGNGNGGKKTMK